MSEHPLRVSFNEIECRDMNDVVLEARDVHKSFRQGPVTLDVVK